MIDLDDELTGEYLAESLELLAAMETDFLALERGGAATDEELVHRLFRGMHSIKGGAGFFGLLKIGELAHRAEDVLALVRSRQVVPTPARVRVLLRAVDRLRELLRDPAGSQQQDIAGILAELNGLRGQEKSPGRLRTLLVEDDFASRLLLQTFLTRYGECHVAVNGREAVEAFAAALDRGQPYHLICMDIMMPEMDGREAVRRIRATEEARGIFSTSGVKIVMTTAVDDIKEVIRCFRELCDAYLTKPIDLNGLLAHMKLLGLVS